MRAWVGLAIFTASIGMLAGAGCSGSKTGLNGDDSSGDDSGSNGFQSGSSGDTTGVFQDTDSGQATGNSGPCKGGHYSGTFLGLYTSKLTVVGVPIPVAGNVDMTLNQKGGSDTTCQVHGEVPVPCDQVFTLQNGTITGVADGIQTEAGVVGGFPYYCSMTGTLDCATKRLDEGWIVCTYCIGPLGTDMKSCATSVGGNFAGSLTANYDTGKLAFVNGNWNGAEALCPQQGMVSSCNNGMMPGPDGGDPTSYLAPDGGAYALPGNYGGLGTWTAAWQMK
jgi:hypothetical protein